MAAGLAQAGEVALNLTQPDRYALRGVTVQRGDGSTLAGVRGIAGFDAAGKSFALDVPGKGLVWLAAADLKAMVFEQKPDRGSPMAQACVSTVLAKKGATQRLALRGDALRIVQGELVVDDAALPPLPTANDRAEVQTVTYDPATETFTVAVQAVNYEVSRGDCGSSGAAGRKGLP